MGGRPHLLQSAVPLRPIYVGSFSFIDPVGTEDLRWSGRLFTYPDSFSLKMVSHSDTSQAPCNWTDWDQHSTVIAVLREGLVVDLQPQHSGCFAIVKDICRGVYQWLRFSGSRYRPLRCRWEQRFGDCRTEVGTFKNHVRVTEKVMVCQKRPPGGAGG